MRFFFYEFTMRELRNLTCDLWISCQLSLIDSSLTQVTYVENIGRDRFFQILGGPVHRVPALSVPLYMKLLALYESRFEKKITFGGILS